MIYLDYSATTPVNEEVINTYSRVCREFIGNPNSLHKLGIEAKKIIDASTMQIANILGVKQSEIIYTSGASEANNLAIKGVTSKYKNRGKHIITTELEHSSIIAPLNYLQEEGYDIDFVKLDDNGLVDLDDLENLIRDDTVLVSIASVNSEVGIMQDMNKISEVVRRHKKVLLHSDVTQSIGKTKFDFSLVDLASMSCQKFFGMKGIGALIKRENLVIEPIIHGGKSTTIYRSGTPVVGQIVALEKALNTTFENFETRRKYVKELNDKIRNHINKYEDMYINTINDENSYILNISIKGIKAVDFKAELEKNGVCVSIKSACTVTITPSRIVMAMTRDRKRALSSWRISLSHLVEREEIEEFLNILDKCYEELKNGK